MENKARATFLQISTNVSQNLEITQSVEEIFPARRNYPWESIIYPSFTHKQSLLFNTNIPYPPDPSRNQKKKKAVSHRACATRHLTSVIERLSRSTTMARPLCKFSSHPVFSQYLMPLLAFNMLAIFGFLY